MRFDRTAGHFELLGNLRVVTALQQQLGNLLLPRPQANRPFLHAPPPISAASDRPLAPPGQKSLSAPPYPSKSHSIRYAMLDAAFREIAERISTINYDFLEGRPAPAQRRQKPCPAGAQIAQKTCESAKNQGQNRTPGRTLRQGHRVRPLKPQADCVIAHVA